MSRDPRSNTNDHNHRRGRSCSEATIHAIEPLESHRRCHGPPSKSEPSHGCTATRHSWTQHRKLFSSFAGSQHHRQPPCPLRPQLLYLHRDVLSLWRLCHWPVGSDDDLSTGIDSWLQCSREGERPSSRVARDNRSIARRQTMNSPLQAGRVCTMIGLF